MGINNIIPTFMISALVLFFIIGVIYTIRNNRSLKKVLIDKKIIGLFNDLSIRDVESMGINFWRGKMTVYEGYILIEKTGYFHLIVKDQNSLIRKEPMTISFQKCMLDKKNNIIIEGKKHRVFGSSNIRIKISSKKTNDLHKITQLINNI